MLRGNSLARLYSCAPHEGFRRPMSCLEVADTISEAILLCITRGIQETNMLRGGRYNSEAILLCITRGIQETNVMLMAKIELSDTLYGNQANVICLELTETH